ncbi:hypothetical protein L227DRAFT_601222 [Lentinus tigrinus ALCF2SS1-6]|uniref:DUF6533 domain-containing protein n=1 Tax=Lentinus tigrinus ALCF2SS1-6 TaxID=1328759 RepID=A0A5C2S841_9APHY|nr:hypothetical protein L227DRAFT_601222 [Lentinus tigrinus ALCF2SS1-6]
MSIPLFSLIQYTFFSVTSSYCEVAAAILIFWEYLALLPQEIDLFWKARLSGTYSDFQIAHLTSCDNFEKAYQTIQLLPYFPWAVFSALRTSALCPPRLRWWLGMLVLFLSSMPIWINLGPARVSKTRGYPRINPWEYSWPLTVGF